MTERPLPPVSPETRFYWEGAAKGALMLQRCGPCGDAYFPPRPFCPRCGSRDVTAFAASGRGTLHSFVINHMPAPGYEPPFVIAAVRLEEGPRMMTNIVDCDQTEEALVLDMPLVATYASFVSPDESHAATLPLFRPADGAASSTGGAA